MREERRGQVLAPGGGEQADGLYDLAPVETRVLRRGGLRRRGELQAVDAELGERELPVEGRSIACGGLVGAVRLAARAGRLVGAAEPVIGACPADRRGHDLRHAGEVAFRRRGVAEE